MSRASTRFTEALLLLLMFFLFVSFCSTGWGVKAKQSGLIKQNHQTSQLKVAQGKISGRERNKISKGTILTKAYAIAKRPHFPGFPASLELAHSSWATTPTDISAWQHREEQQQLLSCAQVRAGLCPPLLCAITWIQATPRCSEPRGSTGYGSHTVEVKWFFSLSHKSKAATCWTLVVLHFGHTLELGLLDVILRVAMDHFNEFWVEKITSTC